MGTPFLWLLPYECFWSYELTWSNANRTISFKIIIITCERSTSFSDLKTVDGVEQLTFVAACLALGLIEDDEEWKRATREEVLWMMPRRLRFLFARILIMCQPLHPEDELNLLDAKIRE